MEGLKYSEKGEYSQDGQMVAVLLQKESQKDSLCVLEADTGTPLVTIQIDLLDAQEVFWLN